MKKTSFKKTKKEVDIQMDGCYINKVASERTTNK